MRHFLIGSVLGAALMYLFIHYGPDWLGSSEQWVEKAASGYRGDARRHRADEALR